jgi:hypothetical protein
MGNNLTRNLIFETPDYNFSRVAKDRKPCKLNHVLLKNGEQIKITLEDDKIGMKYDHYFTIKENQTLYWKDYVRFVIARTSWNKDLYFIKTLRWTSRPDIYDD